MAFMEKLRAQGHYGAGTRILMNLNKYPSSSPPKDLEKAIKHLQDAVRLNPDFADALHNLALAWYNASEYNIVVASIFGRWKSPEDRDNSINDCLQTALDAVNKALVIRYNFPQAHNTRAMILAKLSRLDEAIAATDVALTQDPSYENARDNREKMEALRRQA